MDPTKEPERRAIRRVAELYEARELHRTVLAKPMKVADNAVTERFAGRTRTKVGDLLVMLGAMGGDLEKDLVGVAGGFHPEIYLAELCKRSQRRKRQKRYARTDVVLTPPKRPYSRQELPRVAAGLQELRLLDRDKAYRQALRAVRTLRFYPDRGDRETEFDVRHALAAIWRSKGRYSAAAAALSKAFRLAGRDHRLRARSYHGLASLARDLGDLDVGLEAAIRAGKESLEILDVHGLGRSLITRGQMYVYRQAWDDFEKNPRPSL
ncbi:MAG: tetratricopeptide repeat protein [Thermoanaerobaculia bacterium]